MNEARPALSEPGVVVIGAGQAAGDLANILRQQGYDGAITLVGDEPHPPYRRPPLSKAFLAGEAGLESLYLRAPAAYGRLGVECRFGIGAESIDRGAATVRLFDGSTLAYRHLVLATGGRPRRLGLANADCPNVHYIRSIRDIEKLRGDFLPGRRLVIVGGGYIGLEVASVGIKQGLEVTVVENLSRVLARVAAPELSAFYETAHRRRGVRILTNAGVVALEGEERVHAVLLADGTLLPADLLVVGIGLIPNTELASACGLEVANGIVTDSATRTADPAIYAIGDCASHDNALLRRRTRLESVPNATEQARVCAAAICGKPAAYAAPPWFWSDQFDLKLQMAGLTEGYEQIVFRGQAEAESFCAFYLKDGRLISADAINRPADFMIARRLLGAAVDPRRLGDESVPLKSLLREPA
jgi:3-phenylpropionate/trans-cinnamate dioxygenase ferredoxin reductase subunit